MTDDDSSKVDSFFFQHIELRHPYLTGSGMQCDRKPCGRVGTGCCAKDAFLLRCHKRRVRSDLTNDPRTNTGVTDTELNLVDECLRYRGSRKQIDLGSVPRFSVSPAAHYDMKVEGVRDLQKTFRLSADSRVCRNVNDAATTGVDKTLGLVCGEINVRQYKVESQKLMPKVRYQIEEKMLVGKHNPQLRRCDLTPDRLNRGNHASSFVKQPAYEPDCCPRSIVCQKFPLPGSLLACAARPAHAGHKRLPIIGRRNTDPRNTT